MRVACVIRLSFSDKYGASFIGLVDKCGFLSGTQTSVAETSVACFMRHSDKSNFFFYKAFRREQK